MSASFGSTADKPFSIISGYKASQSKVRGSLYTHTHAQGFKPGCLNSCSPSVTGDYFFLLEIFPFGQMLALSLVVDLNSCNDLLANTVDTYRFSEAPLFCGAL